LRSWGVAVALAVSGLTALLGIALVARRSSSTAVSASPFLRRFPVPPLTPVGSVFRTQVGFPGAFATGIGVVLLALGLVGLVVSTLYWARSARAPLRG
jgi:hypothetical protein